MTEPTTMAQILHPFRSISMYLFYSQTRWTDIQQVNPNDDKHGAKAEYGANQGSEADSVEVWQPFPGKDPSKHAIVWRKVKTSPTLIYFD